jgi:DeoR/GlpR family transcriptional regulator of sugar metabolism
MTLCPVEKASRIITTRDADQEIVKHLEDKGIEVITV